MEKYYSINEVAEMFNVHRMKIVREIKAGRLQAVKMGSEKRPIYRISERDLQQYIEENKKRS